MQERLSSKDDLDQRQSRIYNTPEKHTAEYNFLQHNLQRNNLQQHNLQPDHTLKHHNLPQHILPQRNVLGVGDNRKYFISEYLFHLQLCLGNDTQVSTLHNQKKLPTKFIRFGIMQTVIGIYVFFNW